MRPGRAQHRTDVSGQKDNERDRAIVAAIADGCVASWHEFVAGYTNLLLKVLRQALFVEDDDEVYEVYVNLLKDLHDHKLSQYEGNAALSTWLVFVARGYGLDYLRHKRGRPRPPVGYERLSEREKLVYRWHFVEGVSLDVVLELLHWSDDEVTVDELLATIQRVEDVIDSRTLVRLDRERTAHNVGHGSWRELEYFLQTRIEYIRQSEAAGNEVVARLEAEELRRRLATVRETLQPEEQEVVNLRFVEGLNATEISRRVGWATPRRVYSLIESALGRLRHGMIGPVDERNDTGT
jgi:RNA polymerase sigma factor (sigma-70 family)